MFRPIRIVLFLVFVVLVIALWEYARSYDIFKTTSKIEHNTVLQEMTAMGKLESARYTFRDVVEHELVRQFLPNSKALLIVQGEAIGCIDLTKIGVKDIQEQGDSLFVKLPDPELCVYKIDHQRTRIYDVRFAAFKEQELIGEAYKHAEEQLRKSALEMGILAQSTQNAKMVLKPILEKTSGKKVIFK